MEFILTTGANAELGIIAKSYGFKYGACLPTVVRDKLYFADQDWKNPDRTRYVIQLFENRPVMATVLDLEYEFQYQEVMNWVEEISIYIQRDIIIIPKVNGIITKLPKTYKGLRIVLGYSVFSKYGFTDVPIEQFNGWPIHLLGGCPFRQRYTMERFQKAGNEVISIDSNYLQKQATKYCQFFLPTGFPARNRFWPTLKEFNGSLFDGNGPREAFKRSCEAYISFWKIK